MKNSKERRICGCRLYGDILNGTRNYILAQEQINIKIDRKIWNKLSVDDKKLFIWKLRREFDLDNLEYNNLLVEYV